MSGWAGETEGGDEAPRFPYAAAGLCGASVGAAVWLFLAYSYAWEVTPRDVIEGRPGRVFAGASSTAYVRLHGRTLPGVWSRGTERTAIPVQDAEDHGAWIVVLVPLDSLPPVAVASKPGSPGEVTLVGRLSLANSALGKRVFELDTARGRWTGESVAGLVVGAMGAFVFAVAFSHWRRQRRAIRGAARTGLSGDTKRPAADGPP